MAEALCIEAERLGMEAPSEGMIADCLGNFQANLLDEIQYELESNGMKDAAKYIQDRLDLDELDNQESNDA